MACRDPVGYGGQGRLSLSVVASSGACGSIDGGRLVISGPTDSVVSIDPGSTKKVTGLKPGSYAVTLEGLIAGAVNCVGQASGVQVEPGQNTPITIVLADFGIPIVTSLSRVVLGREFDISYTSVLGAASYIIETDRSAAFGNPMILHLDSSTTSVQLPDTGLYYVRVSAVDPVQGVGLHSGTATVRSTGLSDWVSLGGGTWTMDSRGLVGTYDIGCGSVDCPQADLLLVDSLQPGLSDWRIQVHFSQIHYPYSPSYDLTYATADFGLWVSDSEKVSVGGGWEERNVAMPVALDSLFWSYNSFPPWTHLASGTLNVPTWYPAQWNSMALQKTGNVYDLFFNGQLIHSFSGNFSAPPKVGLHVYGQCLLDDFKLTTL